LPETYTCDRALGWVAEISGRSFSFPVERLVQFTPAQLEEARAAVRSMP
jgi:hypothetical protein